MTRKLRYRATAFLAVLFGAGFAVAAWAAMGSLATVRSAHNATFGTLLVSANGLALYELATEPKGTITCTGSCATIWPPLLVPAGSKPHAGAGVSQSKLGTIKRPDHGTQVTYGGKALYRFASDLKPGMVKGQNVGGFHVVVLRPATIAAAAAETTPVATSTPAATTPASTTTTSGDGYGYG